MLYLENSLMLISYIDMKCCKRFICLFMLLAVFPTLSECGKKNYIKIYVDHEQKDLKTDGSLPGKALKNMKDINSVLEKIEESENNTKPVVILLRCSGRKGELCKYKVHETIKTFRNVTIKAWMRNLPPELTLDERMSLFQAKVFPNEKKSNQRSITMRKLVLKNQPLVSNVDNVVVLFDNCTITNVKRLISFENTKATKVVLTLRDLFCDGCKEVFSFGNINNSSLTIQNSYFQRSIIGVKVDNKDRNASGLYIHIKNVTFKDTHNPVDVKVESNIPAKVQKNRISIKNSHFESSKNPLSIQGNWSLVHLYNTVFERNKKGTVQIKDSFRVRIQGCAFKNNVGGSALYLQGFASSSSDYYAVALVFKTNFTGNINENKLGGAIYADRVKLVVVRSNLIGNVAGKGGGIYSRGDYQNHTVKVKDTTIESAPDKASTKGGIIWSNYKILIANSTIRLPKQLVKNIEISAVYSESSVSVISYSVPFKMECPPNYNPFLEKKYRKINKEKTKNEKTKTETTKTYTIIEYKHMSCKQCGGDEYSLNPSNIFKGFNTSKLTEQLSDCKACPYGGNCTNSITSLDNYWGYRTGDSMYFVPCPDSYCCSRDTVTCKSPATCNKNREGTLCSRCKEGFTLDYYSNDCIKMESSDNRGKYAAWMILKVVSMMLFFMYYDKLFSTISPTFNKLWRSLISRVSRSTKKTEIQMGDTVLEEGQLIDMGQEQPTPAKEDDTAHLLAGYSDTPLSIPYTDKDPVSSNSAKTQSLLGESATIDEENVLFEKLAKERHFDGSGDEHEQQEEQHEQKPTTSDLLPGLDELERTSVDTGDLDQDQNVMEVEPHHGKIMTTGLLCIFYFFYQQYLEFGDKKGFPTNVLSFQFFNGPFKGSPFPGMTRSGRDSLKIFESVLPLITGIFVYSVLKAISKVKEDTNYLLPTRIRAKQAFLILVMVCFSPITYYSFDSLTLVKINGKICFFNDAEHIFSFQQMITVIFLAMWILPLMPALWYSTSSLVKYQMRPNHFYQCLFFPWLALIRFLVARKNKFKPLKLKPKEVGEVRNVENVLLVPFSKRIITDQEGNTKEIPFIGGPLILFRRLLLCLFTTTLKAHPIIRHSVTSLLLVLFLIHECKVNPFCNKFLNRTSKLFLTLLLLINLLELGSAYIGMRGVDVPNLLEVLKVSEKIMVGLPAVCALATCGLALSSCINSVFWKIIKRQKRNVPVEGHGNEEDDSPARLITA